VRQARVGVLLFVPEAPHGGAAFENPGPPSASAMRDHNQPPSFCSTLMMIASAGTHLFSAWITATSLTS
jgi:hypothetical protein